MRNIRHLKFDSNPDYINYRRIFKTLFYKEQYQLEIIFDWQLSSLNYGSKRRQSQFDRKKNPEADLFKDTNIKEEEKKKECKKYIEEKANHVPADVSFLQETELETKRNVYVVPRLYQELYFSENNCSEDKAIPEEMLLFSSSKINIPDTPSPKKHMKIMNFRNNSSQFKLNNSPKKIFPK